MPGIHDDIPPDQHVKVALAYLTDLEQTIDRQFEDKTADIKVTIAFVQQKNLTRAINRLTTVLKNLSRSAKLQ